MPIYSLHPKACVRAAAGLGLTIILVLATAGWHEKEYSKLRWEIMWVGSRALSPAAERVLKPKDELQECAKCPRMVVVPAGEFMMGSRESEKNRRVEEGPRHKVTIAKPFAVSKFEVTFAEWDTCVALGGCAVKPGDQGLGRENRPVINVSWYDAKEYVAWLSKQIGQTYRLLSEAEWEYASRSGSTTAYSWGDDIGKNNASCTDCGTQWDDKQPAPIGSFAANAFGLYDMHGSVWEWVEDCYFDSYNGAPTDGSARTGGDCRLRVVRGGSWNYGAQTLRSANRGRLTTDDRISNLGFRLGRTLITP